MRSTEPSLAQGQLEPFGAERRAAAVQALIGPLVHKLSNTLLAVSGLAELTARRPQAPSAPENLRLVTEESQQAVLLLRSLGDLARAPGQEPQSIDPLARLSATARAIAPWAMEQRIELEFHLGPEGLALGDWPERQLEQHLLGLVVLPWLESQASIGERQVPAAPAPKPRLRLSLRSASRGTLCLCGVGCLPEAAGLPIAVAGLRWRDIGLYGQRYRAWSFPVARRASIPQLGPTVSASALPAAIREPRGAPSLGSNASSPGNRSILLVGGPASELTQEVLAESGFQVERVGNLAEARHLIDRRTLGLLLIEDPGRDDPSQWLALAGEIQARFGAPVGQLGLGAGLPVPRLPAPIRPAQLLSFVEGLLASDPAGSARAAGLPPATPCPGQAPDSAPVFRWNPQH